MTGYELRYGYTLDDVQVLARKAAGANRFGGLDVRDRYDEAWHAIVELLLTAEEPPSEHDLATVARRAIWDTVREVRASYGNRDHRVGDQAGPRFARYWYDPQAPFEEAVIERVALGQILDALSQRDVHVLLAYAAAGDNERGAVYSGYTRSTYATYVTQARRAWLAWWHEGETPPRPRVVRSRAQYVRAGLAPCGTEAAYERHRRRREQCDPCRTAASAARAARKAAAAGEVG